MNLTAEQILENFQKLITVINTEFNGERREKLLKLYDDFSEHIMYAPASGREYFHSCYPGGYVVHILNVLYFADKIYSIWVDMFTNNNINEHSFTREELFFCALNHDLGKIGDENGEHYVPHNEKWKKDRGELYNLNENIVNMDLIDRTFYLLQKYNIVITQNEFLGIKLHEEMFDEANEFYFTTFSKGRQLKTSLPILLHSADFLSSRMEFEQWLQQSNNTVSDVTKQNLSKSEEILRKYTKKKLPDSLSSITDNFFNKK